MNEIEFKFNGKVVTFETERGNVMVNATEMGKIFNKYPKDFLILESTKAFIQEAIKKGDSPYLNVKSEEDLITAKQKTGTFMHRVLALKFAAWLNPEFDIWIHVTIDQLMFGSYKDDDESLKEIAKMQVAITRKEVELEKSPLTKEIDDLRKAIKNEQSKITLRKKMRLSNFRSMFTPEEMNGEEKEE